MGIISAIVKELHMNLPLIVDKWQFYWFAFFFFTKITSGSMPCFPSDNIMMW